MMYDRYTTIEQRIYDKLKEGPLNIEDLSKTLNLPKYEIITIISDMPNICYEHNMIYIAPKTTFIDVLAVMFIVFIACMSVIGAVLHG